MSNRQERRNRRERHLFIEGDRHVVVSALGQQQEIKGDQLDKVLAGHQLDDVPDGQHVWAMFAMFRITHPERAHLEQQHMDSESLLMVTGPGCYRCEQIYTNGAEHTVCPGDPEAGR